MTNGTNIYDPFLHTVVDDPYPIYRELRDEHPVYRCEERDCWVLSRFDDIQDTARAWEQFSNEDGVDLDMPAHFLGPGDFLDSDPPRHDRLRRVLHDRFKPRAIPQFEAEIQARVDQLLDPLLARGGGDISAELAFALPMLTILDLLGYPEDDSIRGLLGEAVQRTAGTDVTPPHALAALDQLERIVLEQLDDRRRNPGDDLMSVIAAAEAEGAMSTEEIPGMCLLLMIAGFETTAGLLSTSILHLAAHPDQRAYLAANPEEIAAGIEEVLRYDAPVQHLMRITTEEVELHGTTIAAGERVLLLWGSANRDERRWQRPDELDVRREQQRHAAFGVGLHHCLGAPLARLEARVALTALLARAPEYEIDGAVERFSAHNIRGLARLPISV